MTETTTDELAAVVGADFDVTDPWDQWDGEPRRAFEHFTAHRLAGRGRTVRATAEGAQIQPSYAYQLAARWQWQRRAAAWDKEQARLYAARMQDRALELGEQHLSIANLLVAKAVQRLRELDPDRLGPKDLLAYIEAGIKVQRLVVGASTERIETVAGDADAGEMAAVEDLTDEQVLEHLAAVQAQIGLRLAETG
jgi:malonyl CoA-acyl carrier protein transacylase